MATELKPTSTCYLTQFAGAAREDGGDRKCIQITEAKAPIHFLRLTNHEALELAAALIEWAAGMREVNTGEE